MAQSALKKSLSARRVNIAEHTIYIYIYHQLLAHYNSKNLGGVWVQEYTVLVPPATVRRTQVKTLPLSIRRRYSGSSWRGFQRKNATSWRHLKVFGIHRRPNAYTEVELDHLQVALVGDVVDFSAWDSS